MIYLGTCTLNRVCFGMGCILIILDEGVLMIWGHIMPIYNTKFRLP